MHKSKLHLLCLPHQQMFKLSNTSSHWMIVCISTAVIFDTSEEGEVGGKLKTLGKKINLFLAPLYTMTKASFYFHIWIQTAWVEKVFFRFPYLCDKHRGESRIISQQCPHKAFFVCLHIHTTPWPKATSHISFPTLHSIFSTAHLLFAYYPFSLLASMNAVVNIILDWLNYPFYSTG